MGSVHVHHRAVKDASNGPAFFSHHWNSKDSVRSFKPNNCKIAFCIAIYYGPPPLRPPDTHPFIQQNHLHKIYCSPPHSSQAGISPLSSNPQQELQPIQIFIAVVRCDAESLLACSLNSIFSFVTSWLQTRRNESSFVQKHYLGFKTSWEPSEETFCVLMYVYDDIFCSPTMHPKVDHPLWK